MAEGANGATKLKGRDWADESDDEGSSDAVGGGASKVGEQEQEQEQVGNEDAVPVDGAEVEAEAEAVAASTGGGDDAAAAAAAAAANAKKDQDDAAVEAEAARIARLMLQPETESDRHARLKVVQGNPSSHLSSVKTFDELNLPDPLLRGIQSMGFEKPSEIQEHALPLLLREPPEHLIAQAQSGSGKTVAFCLGLLLRIDTSKNVTQAMIITPTRELAVQCYHQTIVPMAQFLSPELRVKMALSGEMMDRSAKVSEHIVIGTPGKVSGRVPRRFSFPFFD
jgi:ATP-dependent RNA helicase DDX19/DBP5